MRRTLLLMAAAASAVVIGVAASGAAADPPATANGTFLIPTETDTVTVVRTTADGSLFFHEVAPLINFGDLTGTALDVDNFVVHGDGSFEGQGVETCDSCTLAGRAGSYTAVFTFHGSGATFTGLFHFISGGGGLAGLHGSGTFAGTSFPLGGGDGTYSYNYFFSETSAPGASPLVPRALPVTLFPRRIRARCSGPRRGRALGSLPSTSSTKDVPQETVPTNSGPIERSAAYAVRRMGSGVDGGARRRS
jgi:hypothetical protein